MSHVVVLGSNFAGLTAAIELKRSLGKDHEVSVLSRRELPLRLGSVRAQQHD